MPEAGAGAQGDGRGAARGGSESKAASMAVSKRRWDLLRAALLNKEVDLSEFADVTTKGRLADLGLIRKERIRSGDGHVLVRYELPGGSGLTLKQCDGSKVRVASLAELRTGKDDADRTGIVTVWPSEEALAYLCCRRPEAFEGKAVLELGAGLGLAGLAVAASTNAKVVVLTDGNAEAVERLRENVEANRDEFGDTEVRCEKLDWSPSPGLRPAQFDLVVGADLVYQPELYGPLADAIASLCSPAGGECWLVCPNRNEGWGAWETEAKVRELRVKGKSGWGVPAELEGSCGRWSGSKADYPHLLVLEKER